MKYLLSFILFLSLIYLSADQVTVYNANFALIRTELELDLQKGMQDYYLDDIPSTIEANSVIIKILKGELEIFDQNYEYDLANTAKILEKYLDEQIEIHTESGEKFSGKLQFIDRDNLGIIENHTDRLILINRGELLNINLAELPADFYLKPTLRWRLLAGKTGKYPISLSYLCQGMSWDVTYNAVWNSSENKLDVSSWVTLKNETGKAYHDTILKLIAGDVNKMRDPMMREKQAFDMVYSAAEFEEKSFHDFYLYTLSEPVSISNNQTKQIKLFPTTAVTARSRYEYLTFSNKITSQIIFINNEKEGFGKALPQGVFKIYQIDESDGNMEFIGEDQIQHTPRGERVSINTGSAFDLVGETVIVNQTREGKNTQIRDMKVILKNRSENTKTVTVTHHLDGFGTILAESIRSKKIDANTIEFEKELKADEVYELTWTEKIVY